MTQIPTPQDWIENPEGALAASLDIAKATAAHGDVATAGIALGIASRIMRVVAPLIGSAIGGAGGALAGAAAVQLAESLSREHSDTVKTLTPGQLSLVDQAIAVGLAAAIKKG